MKKRMKEMERFRATEKNSVLICTDIGARGLDIVNVSHIVHYHAPRSCELYIHRCGRAGRMGMVGVSVLLETPEDSVLMNRVAELRKEKLVEFPVEARTLSQLSDQLGIGQHIFRLRKKWLKIHEHASWRTRRDAQV